MDGMESEKKQNDMRQMEEDGRSWKKNEKWIHRHKAILFIKLESHLQGDC